jgi:hypothetical protein
MKITTKFWIGIVLLAVMSPLGLILPACFNSNGAWGEWSSIEIRKFVGYIPKGMERLSNCWNSPMPDYVFKGWEEKGLPHLSLAYILSGLLGIVAVVLIVLVLGKILSKKGD